MVWTIDNFEDRHSRYNKKSELIEWNSILFLFYQKNKINSGFDVTYKSLRSLYEDSLY